MLGDKKIIGVCLTVIRDEYRTEFLSDLYKKVKGTEYKIIVFDSVKDFYKMDEYAKGAAKIYKAINYDVIDALVILYESFYNKDIIDEIIEPAKIKNVPVILVHGERDGCYCIIRRYETAYKKMLRQIFDDYMIHDPFFVAGIKGDEASETRLKAYKAVLREFGIPFSEDNMGYGDYWHGPTKEVMKKVFDSGRIIPEIFVCANDAMAFAVIDELQEHGYRVPEDVMVTGFDGIQETLYRRPRLTTCKEDIEMLTEQIFGICQGAKDGTLKPGIFLEYYKYILSESCRYNDLNKVDYRKRARELYELNEMQTWSEESTTRVAEHIIDCTNLNSLGNVLAGAIFEDSYVSLNNDFLLSEISDIEINDEKEPFTEKLLLFSTKNTERKKGSKAKYFNLSDMVPYLDEWLEDESMVVLNAMIVGSRPCGIFVMWVKDIVLNAPIIVRVTKTLNLAINNLVNKISRKKLKRTVDNSKKVDQVTELMNLKGLEEWFDGLSVNPDNHSRGIIVSSYNIRDYEYLLSTYGFDDVGKMVRFVGEAIQLSGNGKLQLARVTEESFLAVVSVDDKMIVDEFIETSDTIFADVLAKYNRREDKKYELEVNIGHTVVAAGWNDSILTYMNLANGEMLLNSMKKKRKTGVSIKINTSKERYNEFNLLIEKNLFTYYFQPIVDLKSGEIFAYEALMRTSSGINMSPVEIIQIATEYNRLVDIESATIKNVLKRYADDNSSFFGKKIFVNSIPGSHISSEEMAKLSNEYKDYIGNIIFEVTEGADLSDAELQGIRNVKGADGTAAGLAIDDYGSGYSNAINLLRYKPDLIKIDRFLISGIDKDENKRMLVKNTVDFSKKNNIKVIAEGVETKEELEVAVELGCDLVQGYYTARPAPDPIERIKDEYLHAILDANIKKAFAKGAKSNVMQ
jgi:EAL domain-containing protein (putative c-di-GMP-specific phosphodiesterase class I)/DNA-binding LacI/PurR family transcriptional regulator